jgi:hypothetical protein
MTIEKTGLEYMIDLFMATKEKKFKKIIICPELYSYTKTLYRLYNQPLRLVKKTGVLKPIIKEKEKYISVAFSGGKDSLATLLRAMKKYKHVKCFYVMGMSPLYPNEKRQTFKVADYLRIKLNKINLKLNEKLWLTESVIKNQLIYAAIMENDKKRPIAIGFGGTKEIGPQSMAFFHDSKKSFYLFHEFAKKAWGSHKLLPLLKNEIESYLILNKLGSTKLYSMTASCMTPPTDKKNVRKDIEKRFKVKLSNQYECGGCYKCVEKALINSMFFHKKYPKEYIDECKRLIKKKVDTTFNMNGYPHKYLKRLGLE